MAKVFIVNSTDHNYSSAKKYGELHNVTDGKLPIFKTDAMIGILKVVLEKFSANDYLLISGPAWLTIMAAAMLFTKFVEIKFLVFDAKEQAYVVRHLNQETLKIN